MHDMHSSFVEKEGFTTAGRGHFRSMAVLARVHFLLPFSLRRCFPQCHCFLSFVLHLRLYWFGSLCLFVLIRSGCTCLCTCFGHGGSSCVRVYPSAFPCQCVYPLTPMFIGHYFCALRFYRRCNQPYNLAKASLPDTLVALSVYLFLALLLLAPFSPFPVLVIHVLGFFSFFMYIVANFVVRSYFKLGCIASFPV